MLAILLLAKTITVMTSGAIFAVALVALGLLLGEPERNRTTKLIDKQFMVMMRTGPAGINGVEIGFERT